VSAPVPFTPTRAVEVQDETARFFMSEAGVEFMRGIIKARTEDNYETLFTEAGKRAAFELRVMMGARTYFVTQDMLEVAEHAARSMPAQPMVDTDMPCPTGFVVFERALPMPDVHGKLLAFVAFSWSIIIDSDGVRGTAWTYYGDATDGRDEYLADMPWQWKVTRLLYIGENSEGFGMGENAPEVTAERYGIDTERVVEARVYMRRLPLALWALMQSEGVASVTEERADRAARRRLVKSNSPLTGEVSVVRLRRPHHDSDASGESAVEWSRRWIVSGHWRRAWRPSVKAHRLTWIAPFVKGPEDKPLVIPRRVHVLDR